MNCIKHISTIYRSSIGIILTSSGLILPATTRHDPLRPATTRYGSLLVGSRGLVLTVRTLFATVWFSRFGSHGSVLTVRFTRFCYHRSVRTVRFHDSMPRLNSPFSLERFGSHGSLHTGRSEIENRNRKSVECVTLGSIVFFCRPSPEEGTT